MAVTIQNGEAQNKLGNPTGTPNYSNFPIHKHRYTTERFGINDVCGVYNGIEADNVDWRPAHELTTYTLSAPLMTPLYKEKDYIMVARCAILPFNWDKIHVQPNIGDDIDATVVGTSVKAADWTKALNLPFNWFNKAKTTIQDTMTQDGEMTIPDFCEQLTAMLRALIVGEYFYSYGSLLCKMGARFAALYKQSTGDFYDVKFDNVIKNFIENIYAVNVTFAGAEGLQGGTYILNELAVTREYIKKGRTVRELLDTIRENPGVFKIETFMNNRGQWYLEEDTIQEDDVIVTTNIEEMDINEKTFTAEYSKPVDLARLWAYQLANAEYFKNSHVDYIYSAELYRQYVRHIIYEEVGVPEGSFYWNGIAYEYDYLSSYYFGQVVNSGTVEDSNQKTIAEYLACIFPFRRSLKYLDYFTGSKTKPLATGDVTINPDLGGAINVIDISRKGQVYRFLNVVNRVGRKAKDYSLEIMGVKQHIDYHNPLWLGSTRTIVRARTTDNTGEAQIKDENAQTSRLYNVDGKFKFEFNLDRDSIVVGITFYDIERSYTEGVHRSFMHVDRFDMYNPFLQYTGDQKIFGEEYNAEAGGTTFGYTPSYEEFKQEYNTADGGFVVALPGYTFIDAYENKDRTTLGINENIGPDFIRSKPVEFDRFYNSLTGYSLGTYFHFIVDYYNDLNAKRRMAFNPSVAL